jgi:hypothetical protein
MKTLIQTVNNLSDSKSNKTKWRGRIWHAVKSGGRNIANYTINTKTKLNYDVFNRVFTNPSKPLEMNMENINKDLVSSGRTARPFKAKKEKVIKVKNIGEKRGRKPSNIVIKFPKTKFTIIQVAKANNVKNHTVVNYINKSHKNKTELFKQVGTVDKKPGARGKKQILWQKIK